MDPLTVAAIGSQLLGGFLGNRSQARAAREQQRRYAQLQQLIQGQLQLNASPWETQAQSFLGEMSPMAEFRGTTNPSQLFSQDALRQFISRDPAAQLGQAGTTLADLSATGGASNVQDLISSIQGLQDIDLKSQVSGLRGKTTSLGQRFGSTLGKNEAIMRSQLGARNNATLADILNQNNEANLGRRMGASSTLAQLLQAGQGQRLGAMGQLRGMGEFEANMGLEGARLNSQNMENYWRTRLGALGLGGQMAGQRQAGNANLLGILGGQTSQVPQGQNFDWLSDPIMMMYMMGQMNKPTKTTPKPNP